MSGESRQIIVAQGHEGHRLMYVRLLAEGAAARGRKPLVILEYGALRSREFATHLGHLDSILDVMTLETVSMSALKDVLSNVSSTYPIVFPEGDAWLWDLLTNRRLPSGASVLIMRPKSQSTRLLSSMAKNVIKMLARSLVRVSRRYEVFSLTGATTHRLTRWQAPDPGTMSATPLDGSQARAIWDTHTTRPPRYWVGVVGGLSARKNIGLVSDAVASLGPEYGLVLAGRAETDEETIDGWLRPARLAGIPVFRMPGTLTENDFDAVIRGLDCVVVAHTNDGPSGILAKALLAGVNVAAAGAKSLRKDADNSLGAVIWSRLDADSIAKSIATQTKEPNTSRLAPSDGVRTFQSKLLTETVRSPSPAQTATDR